MIAIAGIGPAQRKGCHVFLDCRPALAACCALLVSAGAASTASAGTVGQTGRINNAQGKEVCTEFGQFFKTGSVCARLVVSFSWDFNKVLSKRRVFATSYRIQTRKTGLMGTLYSLKTSNCSGHYAGPPISPKNRYTWAVEWSSASPRPDTASMRPWTSPPVTPSQAVPSWVRRPRQRSHRRSYAGWS